MIDGSKHEAMRERKKSWIVFSEIMNHGLIFDSDFVLVRPKIWS